MISGKVKNLSQQAKPTPTLGKKVKILTMIHKGIRAILSIHFH